MSKKYSKSEVLAFLRSVSVMNVAVNLDDMPISSVLLFNVNDDFTFYFSTRKGSYKYKALVKNSNISISVWEHGKMLVQAKGVATILKDKNKIEKALNKIVDSASTIDNFWPPVLSIEGGDYAVFKMKTDWIRAMDLSNLKIKEGELPYSEYNL